MTCASVIAEWDMPLPSTANLREHHMTRARRAKGQRRRAWLELRAVAGQASIPPAGSLQIELTRLAPRRLDSDNLANAFKAVRDGVADWLGIDDGGPRLCWVYAQEPATAPRIRIRITTQETQTCP